MYSPVPTLTDVLFYTSTDGYNYLTDNRPVYQLDSNIRAIASSLVGLGYGEHSSISGDILTPGKVVELLSDGSIKYPDSESEAHASTAVLGLVVGFAGAGLTKVIWGASVLDLTALGLEAVASGATAGQFVTSKSNSTGDTVILSSVTETTLVLGMVKSNGYITIGKEGQTTTVADTTPAKNYATNFGLARKRNLHLLSLIDAAPIQFSKETKYQGDFTEDNPLAIQYSATTGIIEKFDITSGTFIRPLDTCVVREKYTEFLTEEIAPTDAILVEDWPTRSSWPAISFPTVLEGSSPNYELQVVGAGSDFTNATNLETKYKNFFVSKFYQYARVSDSGDPLYGKVTAKITVLDTGGLEYGGESGRMIVCDFFGYNPTGLEITKNRIVVTGTAADNLYSNANIFPAVIKT